MWPFNDENSVLLGDYKVMLPQNCLQRSTVQDDNNQEQLPIAPILQGQKDDIRRMKDILAKCIYSIIGPMPVEVVLI